MDTPIPNTAQEIISLRDAPSNPETLARAIVGVVQVARNQGQSLDDLTAEVLREDHLLDPQQRSRLRDWVVRAWQGFSETP